MFAIDYITSQGDKNLPDDRLPEGQSHSGHDILGLPDLVCGRQWPTNLETGPTDIVKRLGPEIRQGHCSGRISRANKKGHWVCGFRPPSASQSKPPCASDRPVSSKHVGTRSEPQMYPARLAAQQGIGRQVDLGPLSWQGGRENARRPGFRSACPSGRRPTRSGLGRRRIRPPMARCSSTRRGQRHGQIRCDKQGSSNGSKRSCRFLPPDVFAWDDCQANNKWLISGKGALIMETRPRPGPSRSARCAAKSAEQLWTF